MSEEKQENHVEEEEKKAETVSEEKPTENGDNHSDSEESSDEELGSVEQPAQILDGKRERKSTTRLSLDSVVPAKKEEPVEVLDYTQGKGVKLGDIPYVVWSINGDSVDDLMPMHKLLYYTKKDPKRSTMRDEIKDFQGYPFEKTSKHFKTRHNLMYRFTIPGLRYIIESLGMEWKKKVEEEVEEEGEKKTKLKTVHFDREELTTMLIDFLYEPKDHQKEIPKPKTPASKKNTPAKKTPAKKPTSAKKTTPKTKTPKPKKKSEGDSESTEDSPSKKKKKTDAKKPTQVKIKSATKKAPTNKKAPKRKAGEEGSSEDDEPLVKKSKKKEPTDDEVRKVIKGILKDADLEQVTMKTVCKQVYDMYPDFDMTVRKDFIKTTVKEIIS